MWSEKSKPKSYFIFQEVQKQPKMPAAMPVATSDYWGSLCCRLTVCYLILRCRMSVWKTYMLMWNFVMLEFLILLLSLSPSLVPVLCTSQPISCQSSRVGGFLTAFSLGFILLMKFLLSFFFYPSLLLFQHIRSVGRHVGITFCAKDIRSIRCLKQCEKSLASVTRVLYQSVKTM